MKRYTTETVILLLQLLVFYMLPLFMKSLGAIGMVLLIVASTFALSVFLGGLSSNRIKYLYPMMIAVLFIPSVFIYYNESALIHAVWYLVISTVGILIGTLSRTIFHRT